MSKRQKKKILILTLGAGRKLPNGASAGYTEASYKFHNEGDVITTAYLAEPLVSAFRPDMVFVIGTIKSVWLEFYQYFTEKQSEEAELAFCELDPANGKDVSAQQLREKAEIVNRIFEGGMDKAPFSRDIRTRAILTRYGMNNEEMLENYQLIGGISAYMEKDTDYEIAFDITHSFRSLPIYNLIIFNYLRVISDSTVRITHVYYGNFEGSRENQNIAPILDLQDLIHVMNLTSSVSEFKNTGNCRTLLTQLPEGEKDLREALEEFDWATQINSFDKVQEALRKLLRLTQQEQREGSRYADMRRMIYDVLCRKFLKWDTAEGSPEDMLEGLSMADQRLMTSNWYLKQNRYGQAVATAYEALKSYLVPIYLKEVLGKEEVGENDCMEEGFLSEAIWQLDKAAARYCGKRTEELSETERLFVHLQENKDKARRIRNRFAHNLTEGERGRTRRMKPEDEKECIRGLIKDIEALRDKIEQNDPEVAEVYALRRKR